MKDTGEITSPIMTFKTPLTLKDIFKENAEIYSKIYDVINIVDNIEVYNNIYNYYVDINTKELKLKKEFEKPEIKFMEGIK